MTRLSLHDVSVAIAGETRISDVSLSVSSHEIVAIVGKNGSGKSSLLRGVFSYGDVAVSGAILLEEKDITTLPVEEKARLGLFFSPQHTPELPGVSLISFIYKSYSLLHEGSAPDIVSFRNNLIALAKRYSLDALLLEREVGVGLSGGEKKQSELLQLLALTPSFIVLDEIDSGVDIEIRNSIITILSDMKQQGAAILLVTHNLDLLEKLDLSKVYVCSAGRIIDSGDRALLSDIQKRGYIE